MKPKRWSGLQAFWDKARADDEAFEQFEKELQAERGGFPESTVAATVRLRKFYPERLEDWFANHPGLREFIEKNRANKAE